MKHTNIPTRRNPVKRMSKAQRGCERIFVYFVIATIISATLSGVITLYRAAFPEPTPAPRAETPLTPQAK